MPVVLSLFFLEQEKSMPTAKQMAARALFAHRSRTGQFRRAAGRRGKRGGSFVSKAARFVYDHPQIHRFVKKHKLVSRGAKLLGEMGVPRMGLLGSAAELAGYGHHSMGHGKHGLKYRC